jgi:SEC-C motif domain protein
MLCPCCSELDYSDCCKPYHTGTAAPTALALMRSRYSAYALGLIDYIIQTTHPKTRASNLKKWADEIRRFSQESKFIKLEIEGLLAARKILRNS